MSQPKSELAVVGRNNDQLDLSKKEIIFWEEGNPRCVVNLMRNCHGLREKVLALPPSYLSMSDHELEKLVDPSEIDHALRLSFWDEYTIAMDNDSTIRAIAVYSKVCSREFFNRVTNDPKRLAYMMRPPRDYMLQMRSLLDLSMRRIEEFIRLPVKKTMIIKGREVEVIDTRLIAEIVKITTLIDNRVKGAVAQKLVIDQTSKNMNLNVNKNYEAPGKIEDIDKELARVSAEIHALEVPVSQPDEEVLINGFKEENEPIEVTPSRSEKERA